MLTTLQLSALVCAASGAAEDKKFTPTPRQIHAWRALEVESGMDSMDSDTESISESVGPDGTDDASDGHTQSGGHSGGQCTASVNEVINAALAENYLDHKNDRCIVKALIEDVGTCEQLSDAVSCAAENDCEWAALSTCTVKQGGTNGNCEAASDAATCAAASTASDACEFVDRTCGAIDGLVDSIYSADAIVIRPHEPIYNGTAAWKAQLQVQCSIDLGVGFGGGQYEIVNTTAVQDLSCHESADHTMAWVFEAWKYTIVLTPISQQDNMVVFSTNGVFPVVPMTTHLALPPYILACPCYSPRAASIRLPCHAFRSRRVRELQYHRPREGWQRLEGLAYAQIRWRILTNAK